ncbi:hypothetical protein BDQ17DRAFT_1250746 [Cyathus striatus]|nr:hypothetical protein BDQ17DRAFT_1250746 [Cyathus striatus]
MTAKTKSQSLKQREDRKVVEEWISHAADVYHQERKKPKGKSVCKIALDFEQIYLESTGKHIKLNYNTIIERVKGRHSLSERAYKQEWLLPSETELILDLLTKSANQGFPFTHRLLKETVDKLVRA